MTYLGEWLKEIIIIVLFAVFIDLLLPNRAMERYVKFVVSLLILLTLLSPVMRILSGSEPEKMIAAAFDNIGGRIGGGAEAQTEQILKQGELLRKSQEAEALQYAGDQAALQMKQQIELETGKPVERVTVKLSRQTEDSEAKGSRSADQLTEGQLFVNKVEVVMGSITQNMEEEAQGKAIKVEKIEKVDIRIQDKDDGASAAQEEAQAVSGKPVEMDGTSSDSEKRLLDPAEEDKLIDSIAALLKREWGIPKDSVTVLAGIQEED